MKMEETIISNRRRVNIGYTASGKITWDITVELFNKTNEETVKEATELKNLVEEHIGGK
jgi:hypothetical protein